MTAHQDTTDLRFNALSNWLMTAIPAANISSLRPASSDASFRRYFRVDMQDGSTLIIMDAPPPQEDVRPFIQVDELFRATGVSVPGIVAQNIEAGFLALTDLGSTTYLSQLNPDTAHKLYIDAIDALIVLQTQSKADQLPAYDRTLLTNELSYFTEWYLKKHLQVTLTEQQQQVIDHAFEKILANNLAQSSVYVHRDFHSRNLMVLPKGNPGILDFQDAVYGPITYDLVSLLRDAYIQWDEEMVLDWAVRYWEKARRAGLPVPVDIDDFYRDFEYMGLQRHLKILGIFARLYHRDGKDAYLNDIPVVLEYVLRTGRRYRDFIPLVRLIENVTGNASQVGYTF